MMAKSSYNQKAKWLKPIASVAAKIMRGRRGGGPCFSSNHHHSGQKRGDAVISKKPSSLSSAQSQRR